MASLIASAFGQNSGSNPANLGGSGTGVQIFAQSNNAAAPFSLFAPGGVLEGRRHQIVAAGKVFVHGTSPLVKVGLYASEGGVPASSPLVSSSYDQLGITDTGVALTTAAWYPWMIIADLQGDSSSGVVQGSFRTFIDNSLQAEEALDTTLDGVVFGPAASTPTPSSQGIPYAAVIGITFGVGDALNVGVLNQFDIFA